MASSAASAIGGVAASASAGPSSTCASSTGIPESTDGGAPPVVPLVPAVVPALPVVALPPAPPVEDFEPPEAVGPASFEEQAEEPTTTAAIPRNEKRIRDFVATRAADVMQDLVAAGGGGRLGESDGPSFRDHPDYIALFRARARRCVSKRFTRRLRLSGTIRDEVAARLEVLFVRAGVIACVIGAGPLACGRLGYDPSDLDDDGGAGAPLIGSGGAGAGATGGGGARSSSVTTTSTTISGGASGASGSSVASGGATLGAGTSSASASGGSG